MARSPLEPHSVCRTVVVAIVYGLAFALGRWGLDELFGVSPITYTSIFIVGTFGYLTGSLTSFRR